MNAKEFRRPHTYLGRSQGSPNLGILKATHQLGREVTGLGSSRIPSCVVTVQDEPIIAPSALKHGLREDEILAHADEFAARFEDYEPNPADEVDAGAVALLRAAVAERSQAERHLLDAVAKARTSGMSWAAIGTLVGTSGEAARQRYASRIPRDRSRHYQESTVTSQVKAIGVALMALRT